MNVGVIIPAAGSGQRMGGVRKAFIEIAGQPMLRYSVDVFLAHPEVQTLVVALAREDLDNPPEWLRHERIRLVSGGAERAHSVRAGLAALPEAIDTVLVHDAARPLVTAQLIDVLLNEVSTGHSATLAVAMTDTLHETDEAGQIRSTPDRSLFWRAQTPQIFPRDVLQRSFAAHSEISPATDEAGMAAWAGYVVRIVAGPSWNIKVTSPEDVAVVEAALCERNA